MPIANFTFPAAPTTVGHSCHVVEDRRDDPAFDELGAYVEQTVNSAFRSNGVLGNE